MPKDEFHPEDPFELNGRAFLTREDTTDAMAECFVEEFLRMGHTAEQVLALFRNPHYVGPNLAFEKRGEPFLRDLIAEVFARRGKAVTWPGQNPLTPVLPPSEGEREDRSPSNREPVAVGSTGGLQISETCPALFPLPPGGGEGPGEGANGVSSPAAPAQTIETDDSWTDPMGASVAKVNLQRLQP